MVFLTRYIVLFLFLLSIGLKAEKIYNSCGIPAVGDKKLAKQYYDFGNYKCALEEYKILVAKKPNSIDYNYRLGICYLRSNEDKTKAVKFLEFVAQQDKYDVQVLFDLGQAYHYSYRFDDAIKTFEKYNNESKYKDSVRVAKHIRFCSNGKELIKYPLDVKFENLGDKVNTPYMEYLPFISDNENEVFFTTKRSGTMGNIPDYDGEYISDVYAAKVRLNDAWSRSKSVSALINTDLPEEMVGLSRNGIYLIYNTDNFGFKDLSISKKPKLTSRSYPRPTSITSLNSSKANDLSATITNDGMFMIFASDREGGFGGFDLYMTMKLPNGEWGLPVNLGPKINTDVDENYPSISADGKTLYFASEGHSSMGGYDIFKTTFDEWTNRWNVPMNIGYPINTPMDDYNICFTSSGRHAYISQIRPGGYGGYDIYRVTFYKNEPLYTLLRGQIVTDTSLILVSDSLKKDIKKLETKIGNYKPSAHTNQEDSVLIKLQQKLDMTNYRVNLYNPVTLNDIKIVYKETGIVFGRYKPNENTGNYVIILPEGNYILQIRNEGFEDYNEVIRVQGKVYYKPEIVRNIYLKPKPEHIPSDL